MKALALLVLQGGPENGMRARWKQRCKQLYKPESLDILTNQRLAPAISIGPYLGIALASDEHLATAPDHSAGLAHPLHGRANLHRVNARFLLTTYINVPSTGVSRLKTSARRV